MSRRKVLGVGIVVALVAVLAVAAYLVMAQISNSQQLVVSPEAILPLDLSQATFSHPPGAPEETGALFIPVRSLSDILNAPPSQATAMGILITGPMMGTVYFRVEKGIAYLEISADCWKKEAADPRILISEHWKKEKVYTNSNNIYLHMGLGVAGEIRFNLVYPGLSTLVTKPWWWPKSITVAHNPNCTWYTTLQW